MTQPGAPGTCPRCGTAFAPDQEYCLECGLQLPTRRGPFERLASAWAGRGWYPGDWIWPVFAFLVLAALGALAAILLSNGTSSAGPAIVATPPGATSAAPTVTTAPPPTATAPPATTAPPPTAPAPPPNRIIAWPGQNGFTIVLESIPTNAGRGGASAAARRAPQ